MSRERIARSNDTRQGAVGLPAIGPGARRRKGGQFLAEQGRRRKSSPTWRKVWCNVPECHGHEDETRCPR